MRVRVIRLGGAGAGQHDVELPSVPRVGEGIILGAGDGPHRVTDVTYEPDQVSGAYLPVVAVASREEYLQFQAAHRRDGEAALARAAGE
jgi:hypothetical protein